MARLFVRRRGGGIEVRLNAAGRAFVAAVAQRVAAAERGDDPGWGPLLASPIEPAGVEDPLVTLGRQRDVATNAELVGLTVGDDELTDAEAWAWLSTLQLALRALADENAITDDDALASSASPIVDQVHTLQLMLFALASCL